MTVALHLLYAFSSRIELSFQDSDALLHEVLKTWSSQTWNLPSNNWFRPMACVPLATLADTVKVKYIERLIYAERAMTREGKARQNAQAIC